MAGKARRVASRQAQLSRKRKRQLERQPEAPAESPAMAQAPVSVPPEVEAQDNETAPTTVDTTVDTFETAPDTPSVPVPVRRSNRPITQRRAAASTASPIAATGRGRRERPATFNYIGPELRRITAMASVVLAVIIALGFVL